MVGPLRSIMQHEAVFIGISQLGAVFAGFIAIFTVFTRPDGRFSRAESLRIRSMLYASFLTVLGSLLPLVVSAYGVVPPALWRRSAILFLATGLIAVLDAARHNLSLERTQRMKVGRVHFYVSWALALAAVVLTGLTALGHGGPGHYLLALLLTVAVAISNFVTTTLLRLL